MTHGTGRILVVRHGETAWSREGRHTGRTDVPLSAEGEVQARGLADVLSEWPVGLVLTSPLQRARRTAELAGLHPEVDPDLAEWDYGVFEGRTTGEIRADDPGWSVWDSPPGLGESLGEIALRAGRVLRRCGPLLEAGDDVILVAHAHLLRVLTATWIGLPPRAGEGLVLGPAGTGILGHERETRALLRWNA